MTIIKQNGQPGSDYNITIRGLSSPNGNGPLVLIDGVPGSLNTINPQDIESVDVLKDAASAAIYGSRAANGVVLVTSKKGKSGEAVISYDVSYGESNPAKKISLLNAKQYAQIMDEAQLNSNPKTPKNKIFFTQGYIDSLGVGTDWLQQITNTNALSQDHHLGISGGTDKSKYSISASYSNEEGIYDLEKKSNYERMGIRVNTEHKVKKYLTIGENLTYTHRNSKALGNGNIYGNFIHDVLQANPIIKPYDPSTPDGFGTSVFDPKQSNPVASMHYQYNGVNDYDDIIGDAFAELDIIEGLKFRSDLGGTLSYNYFTDHTDTFKLGANDTQHGTPDYKQSMKRDFSYNWDNVFTYEKGFGKHDFSAMLGMNAEDTWFYSLSGERKGYLSNTAPILTNVTNQLIDTTNGDFGKGDSRFSYFGRLNYNYDEKYLATFTLRRDASSRFGQNNRVGYFPSASIGWVMSKESFMESTSTWLDFFKLRGSWGQNGKEPPQPYQFLATVGSLSRDYTFGGAKQVGTSPNILSNPGLKWEASTQTNIGFDSRFLKNFSFNFDWYNKTSTDWIVQKTVTAVSGIGGVSDNLSNIKYPFVNGGNVTNKGVEFDLGYIKNFGDFELDLKANLAYNKNMVKDVPDSIIHGSGSVLYNGSEEFYRVQSGYPLGYFWGYKTAGIFQDTTQVKNDSHTTTNPVTNKTTVTLVQPGAKPGDVIFVDRNHDGKIDPLDKTQIGDPNPHFVFGFNIGASYKGLDLAINLQGMAGNDMVQSYRGQDAQTSNYTSDFLNRWTPTNPSNKMPRVTLNNEANKNWRNFSDLSIQDASFLRVKTVSLGYDLKKLLFSKTSAISQLRFYVSGTNLITFTKYTGFDPENGYGSYYNSTGQLTDAYASGIDLGNYPVARTYMIGLNLKF
jgi:TonB-linked SusC/RagA family outer membrane protein